MVDEPEEQGIVYTYSLTVNPKMILRDQDDAWIPDDPDNIDYQDYLAWLEAGNVPNAYEPPAVTLAAPDMDARVTALETEILQLRAEAGLG